ncbi:protein mono-ADP-ribosyltransferase PARP15-like [Crassostrea angulata]|uniref:protein mono-ADP-ribosyltransferase PARP15-like n=1 Tax=Magallana angulata TaxID=2784310 RepID=UPI0022B16821|nr:protein mono-ADP-ribosyltransferase PARP15-like [Crassostrea angulata]
MVTMSDSTSTVYSVSSDSDLSTDEDTEENGVSREYKSVNISVKEGALEKEEVDVIVNSTSDKLKLRHGRGSRALLEAAGNGLQTECDQKYPTGITKGDVAVTGPGNLRCKSACHGCLKKYGSNDAEKIHMEFISKCLKELDNQKLSSIAFPGLTTGFHKFPKNVASKNACRAISQYIDANPNTSLKEVRFVIHPEDKETFKAFCDAVQTWDLSPITEIERKVHCRFLINQITVLIKVDKIEEEEIDMIVNSVNKTLDLGKGSLSKAIATAAGSEVAEECRRDHPSGVSEGNVVVTSAGNLKCKKICHACVPSYNQNDKGVSKTDIQNIVIKCLEKADENQCNCVAFPAFGTLYKNYPAQITAGGMLKGVDQFSKSHTQSSVKRVIIVIYGDQHAEISKAFVDESATYRGACSGPERGTQEFCRQQYHRELHPPEYWTEFTSDKSVKLWKTECDKGYHKLVDVDSSTHKAVDKLVQSTWQSQKVGHGRDAQGLSELKYTSIKVLKVQRLENIDVYENYSHFRARLFHKAGDIGVFEQLASISQSTGDIATTKSLKEDSVLTSELYHEINEHFLFHGTKPDTYKKILSQGLDFRMAGEKGMFGQGVYLAESSTKADQYTDDKLARSKAEKRMFLVRSCLGKIHLAKTANKLQRPPCFQTGCESDSCEHPERQRCDSVVGDGSWIFREFVTYNHHQNYPEYLITYKRV